MASPNKAIVYRATDTITSDQVFAAFEQIRSVAEDCDLKRTASAVPSSFSLTFATLQPVACDALAKKVPNLRWRRIVAFALARFIIMGMGEAGPSKHELINFQQDALRAKILIDRLAVGPYVGPRQKAKLDAIGKLLVGVSEDLKERAQSASYVCRPGRQYVPHQFLEDLAEGFQAAIGKRPTLTDRSFGTPFVDLATMAAAAARDFASRLDSNLADRLPQPTQVRYLIRQMLDHKWHRPKPLWGPAARRDHWAGQDKHSPR